MPTEKVDAGSRVGKYEIVSLLSAGGMGELYLARDPELGRDLVLKLLPRRGVFHPDSVERFVREARAASALNHPNIVTVYEVGESPSGHFIAMELIEAARAGVAGRIAIDSDDRPNWCAGRSRARESPKKWGAHQCSRPHYGVCTPTIS